MDLDEALAVVGGRCIGRPPTIPELDWPYVSRYLSMINLILVLDGAMTGKPKIGVTLVESASVATHAFPVDGEGWLVTIPVGAIARVRSLFRLLLDYWDAPSGSGVVADLSSEHDSSELLPRFEPLFRSYQKYSWWNGDLLDFDRELGPIDKSHLQVMQIINYCLLLLVGHEMGHILRGHRQFLQIHSGGLPDISDRDVRRALEIDADVFGTTWVLEMLHHRQVPGLAHDPADEYVTVSYAATILYAAYDVMRKSYSHYDKATHPHPLVRRQIFSRAAHAYGLHTGNATMAAPCIVSDPELIKRGLVAGEEWEVGELGGWLKAMSALHSLDIDVLLGKFGGSLLDDRRKCVPVTALHYPTGSPQKLLELLARENSLYLTVQEKLETSLAGIDGYFHAPGYRVDISG